VSAPCDRCGIDVPARGMLCDDCAEVEAAPSGEVVVATRVGWRVTSTRRSNYIPPTESQRMDEEIRRRNAQGQTDQDIALALRLSDRTVLRRRKRLGVPPVPRTVLETRWARARQDAA
jgi:DNA-binding NarL/FixJ family response regulator